MFSLSEIDKSWWPHFQPHIDLIDSILSSLSEKEITPSREQIFRSFNYPLSDIRVVILGQDPYPTYGVADGLAFSVSRSPIPASLRNIFEEYCEDLGFPKPTTGNLESWAENGVLLLNTSLTTEVGERDKHKSIGWQILITDILGELSRRDVVAILWGNSAKLLGCDFKRRIESAHPSPLSAHRGFFGSKPFSKSNQFLRESGQQLIDWKLS